MFVIDILVSPSLSLYVPLCLVPSGAVTAVDQTSPGDSLDQIRDSF